MDEQDQPIFFYRGNEKYVRVIAAGAAVTALGFTAYVYREDLKKWMKKK